MTSESPQESAVRDAVSFENEVAGLILLNTGLVSEEVLAEAIQESQREPKRSLAAILADSGKISQANREQLERSSKAVVGWTLVVAAPALEGRDPPADSNTLKPPGLKPPGESTAEAPEGAFVTRLGGGGSDFQTIKPGQTTVVEQNDEPLGDAQSAAARHAGRMRYRKVEVYRRGGLAQVWVGKDLELGRTVAVKEILPDRADDRDARDLFDSEAQKTASLEHPSIIPVYGKGYQADGRPYYAMRFVTGTTYLEEIERWHHSNPIGHAADRSLSFRKLLLHLLDVCNAVHYAHCNGILHLDLKPQNIMLGNFGETFVLDWGLSRTFDKTAPARAQPSSSPGSGTLNSGSSIGSIAGTPQYMSPEQAQGRGDRLGPHTDVYSLGATLYHLLVGRPPRVDAKTAEDAWQQARSGIFNLPRSVRSDVNRDLQAICQKAMSYDVTDRYLTADELRRDLECWLADEDVTARRLKPWHPEQILRVIHRKRTIALSVTLALVVFSVILVMWSHERVVKREEAKIKERIDEVLTKATSDDPSMTTVLEVLLKHYKEASSSADADDATIAQNLEKIANICEKIATTDEAIQYQTEAIGRYERILKADPSQPQKLASLVNAKKERGRLLLKKGDFTHAAEYLKELLGQFDPQTRDKGVLQAWAEVLQNLANAYKGNVEFKDSALRLEQSERILKDLLREHGNTSDQVRDYRGLLADNEGLYGDVKLAQGNSALALQAYNEARKLRKEVLDSEPQNGEAAIRCAWAADNFLRLARRREDEDNEHLRKALDTWDQEAHSVRLALYESKRTKRMYRRELAWSSLFRGQVLIQLLQGEDPSDDQSNSAAPSGEAASRKGQPPDKWKDTRKELARCYELARQLTDEDLSNADSRSHRAYSAIDLAYLDVLEQNFSDAREKLIEAGGYLQDLMVDDSTEVLYKSALRLALLAELETKSDSAHAKSLRKQAAEKLRLALKHSTSGERPREWELNMLRQLKGMKEIVDQLETAAASN